MNDHFTGSDEELNARARRIDLAHQPDFALGPVSVQPSLRKIVGADGEAMLEPKVMQVLVALGDPAGIILSRDDLIERCWEGRIVGDTSINRVISLLRSGLKDVAGDAVVVENVPKVGYRIVVAVDDKQPDEPLQSHSEPQAAASAGSSGLTGQRKFGVIAAFALALVAVVTALVWWSSSSTAPLREIRVAMLPLEFSEGVDPIYAKGFESELRSQLARAGGIEVTTSESAAMLVAEGVAPAEIGERLGVDYVWSGTLSSDADRIVLSARMVKSGETTLFWEEDLVSAPDNAQFLPLRTARAGVIALGRPVTENVSANTVTGEDYAIYLTAMGLVRARGFDERLAAANILEQVVSRNPDFADGLAGLAKVNYMFPTRNRDELEERRKIALEQAKRAIELDPNSIDALKVLGSLSEEGPEARLAFLRRATELDPGDAEAWFWYSQTQSRFSPIGGDELQPMVQMVAVDPLWPASWRASDKAIALGEFELARKLENDIIAASATPQQRILAEARLARMNGDLSEYIRLVGQVDGRLNSAQRRWGFAEMRMARFVLGLPPIEDGMSGENAIILAIHNQEIPSRRQLEEVGITAGTFFNDSRIASEMIPLLLADGRGDELLEYYDAQFSDIADWEAFSESEGAPQSIIPYASPYFVLALREAGREAEAREHLELTRKWIKVWRSDDIRPGIYPELFYLELAAIEGNTDEAIRIIRRLPDFGWPLQLGHIGPSSTGLLFNDPLFDEIRELPEVRAVLDPIRAKLAQERREVLALGI